MSERKPSEKKDLVHLTITLTVPRGKMKEVAEAAIVAVRAHGAVLSRHFNEIDEEKARTREFGRPPLPGKKPLLVIDFKDDDEDNDR